MIVKVVAMFSHGQCLKMAQMDIAEMPFIPSFNRKTSVFSAKFLTLVPSVF
jgi:hypothetical protein